MALLTSQIALCDTCDGCTRVPSIERSDMAWLGVKAPEEPGQYPMAQCSDCKEHFPVDVYTVLNHADDCGWNGGSCTCPME